MSFKKIGDAQPIERILEAEEVTKLKENLPKEEKPEDKAKEKLN